MYSNGFPHGTAPLSKLVSSQAYDIVLYLNVPRTPSNLATGNFMVNLALSSPSAPIYSPAEVLLRPSHLSNESISVNALSRRAIILTYASPLVDKAHQLIRLPWFLVGWKKESEVLRVTMFENIEFARGWANIPDKVQVLIEADEKMSFYEVRVEVHARFKGLKYVKKSMLSSRQC